MYCEFEAPPDLTNACLRRFASGVLKLDFSAYDLNAEVLEAISVSSAAATLRKVDFRFSTNLTESCGKLFSTLKSVETVYLGGMINLETVSSILAAVSKTLRRLQIVSGLLRPETVLQVALSNNLRLSSLRLGCALATEERHRQVAALKDLLRANPTFAAFLDEFHLEIEDYKANVELDSFLREIRPALHAREPPFQDGVGVNPIEVFLPFGETCIPDTMTTELLNSIASRFPSITKLYLSIPNWAANDLSVLPSVTAINLRIDDLQEIPSVWPPSLRRLELDVRNAETSISADLLATSIGQCTSLTSLLLTTNCPFSRAAVTKLLTSLPKLRDLDISCDEENPGDGPFYVTHPNLRAMPVLGNSEVRVGLLPRLQAAHLREPHPLSPGQVPELLYFTVDNYSAIENLFTFAERHRLLRLVQLSSSSEDARLPASLYKLTNLRVLNCRNISGSGSFWNDYFQANPRLTEAFVAPEDARPVAWPSPFIDFESHPRPLPFLMNIEVSNLGDLPDAPLGPIRLTGSQLPWLTKCLISIRELDLIAEIALRDLPNLRHLYLVRELGSSAARSMTQISVENCPRLADICIREFGISTFTLSNLPCLEQITTENFHLPPDNFADGDADAETQELPESIKLVGLPVLKHGWVRVIVNTEEADRLAQVRIAELMVRRLRAISTTSEVTLYED